MKKIITYGTFDLLHYGHIRLLERAKGLGDYLIVGVTSDDYDKTRGKINNRQSLSERIEAVRQTGLADEIIVEEYEGQKIDDIQKYGVDIFTVGSDWEGYFDYLKEFCQVIYLPRTEGISSTEIRGEQSALSLGLVGTSQYLNRVAAESAYVNGVTLSGLCADRLDEMNADTRKLSVITDDYDKILDISDAVYIHSMPHLHYNQIKKALLRGKHVLCESPVALTRDQCKELYTLAEKQGCILEDALRTAFATAFNRLVLLAKGGSIGKIVSVDAVCTSLRDIDKINAGDTDFIWNSMSSWGPTALLPVFEILGTDYRKFNLITHFTDDEKSFDSFTKADFVFENAVASIQVGTGVKSEGNLVVSGTGGYIYVPAPWWKTDYFEVRYENPANNKRFFYQLDGEGIRYGIADFVKNIEQKTPSMCIVESVSEGICGIMEAFENRTDMEII